MAWTRGLVTVAVLVVVLAVVNGGNRRRDEEPSGPRNAMREVGKSNFEFTHNLYKEIAKSPGNVFFSPLSVHSILSMLSLGAKENTLKQLREGLRLPEANLVKTGYQLLNKNLKFTADKGVTVNIANKIYTSKSYPVNPDYKKVALDYFNSDFESVDFAQGEKVRRQINQWVAGITNGKITDVVPSGSFSSDTAMALVNAVYFKGRWLTEFDPKNTTDGKFHGINGEENVRYMESTSEFPYKYSKKLNSRIVELAYNGDKVSMVIILPFESNEFNEMETLLATTDSRDYLPGQYDKSNVRVKIPKFRLEKETPMAGHLADLGMTDMFANNADLSGLTTGGPGLKVSKIMHKAFIEVNEEGSEAAATTVAVVQTLSLNSDDSRPIDFIADQPFIFMLRHKQSNSILFMGRYSSPSDGGNAEFSPPIQARPNRKQNTQGLRRKTTTVLPENDFDVRSGAGPSSGSNIQYTNNQSPSTYDLEK